MSRAGLAAGLGAAVIAVPLPDTGMPEGADMEIVDRLVHVALPATAETEDFWCAGAVAARETEAVRTYGLRRVSPAFGHPGQRPRVTFTDAGPGAIWLYYPDDPATRVLKPLFSTDVGEERSLRHALLACF